jgi:Carboxypeptidase regulatory-like domain
MHPPTDAVIVLAGGVIQLMAARFVPSRSEIHGRQTRAWGALCNRVLTLVVAVALMCGLALSSAANPIAAQTPASRSSEPESAAPQSKQASVQRVSALCVDANGNPVAGAEVHLFQHTGAGDGRFAHAGPFTSDALGKAVCAQEIFSNQQGNFDRWIYARVPGRLVGVARCAKWTNRAAFNREGRVQLMPSRSIEGRVTVPPAFDPTKVTVRVRTLHIFTGPGQTKYQSFPREDHFPGLDTALPQIFERQPDVSGSFRFDDIPVRGRLYVVTVAERLAEAQWMNANGTFDRSIHLNTAEESLVSGHVLTPDGKPAVGVDVTARLSPVGRRRSLILTSFRAVTDASGQFAIHGLPQTEFVLSVRDPEQRFTFRPQENLFVQPGNDPRLSLKLEAGTLVSGRVLDAQGQPVEGASLSAVNESQAGSGLAHDFTDANGHYRLRLPAGGARLYFDSLPDGFAYPQPLVVKELDIKPGQADLANLDFTLRRERGPSR